MMACLEVMMMIVIVIMTYLTESWVGGCELDSSGSGYEPVVGCCEHGNQSSGFIKAEFLD